MKSVLTFLFAITTVLSFAQPTCQYRHNLFDDLTFKKIRSGDESKRSDTINVINYSVYMDFTQATSNLISANCEVKFETLMDVQTISLDLLSFNIDSIIFQGNPVTYNYNDTLIVANLGGTITSGTIDSIMVYYNGTPQMDPSGWGGFYFQGDYFYNLGVGFQSDPHNFGRSWHPCFDNFVERATYDFEILTNNGNTAYCNGTRTNVQTVGTDSLLTNWVMSTEIPTYLASVAVSDYVHVSDFYDGLVTANIPVWLIAKASDTANIKSSFINLNNALIGFEQFYGPYEWEKIGFVMVPFNSGAMEHATNIAYPLVTANGTLQFETLMAHEFSHHWWGDWVTCATAEEMWINEGMAVYSEHVFLEHVYSWDAYMTAMRDNHKHVLHRAHIEDGGHYALNAVPIAYTYGEHSYHKGADVMHTLRGYIGSADFFEGLKIIQNSYGGSHITSSQFRDMINTLPFVDVTDFFDDWIFQPGFSQFSISEWNYTTISSNSYTIDLVVDQKLKGASNFHDNVPLLVTVIDADWNTYETEITVSGDYEQISVGSIIEPVFVALNMDEQINDAITAENETITTTGIRNYDYAMMRLDVDNLVDSAFIRVEHNWVYADGPLNIPNVVLSQDRYWNVHGVDLDNITGTMRFEFNAQQNATGDLDNSILQDVGGQPFHEDSVVLMYRPNATSEWQIHPSFSINYLGSPTDKKGWCEAGVFMPGQYCFGYKVNSVGISENSDNGKIYSIYPNPVSDTIFIDLTEWDNKQYAVEIFAINGVLLEKRTINGGTKNTVQLNDFETGTYLFIISDKKGKRLGSKRIVIE